MAKKMTAEQVASARAKLARWIAAKDKERGRPLTDEEKLRNLFAALSPGAQS